MGGGPHDPEEVQSLDGADDAKVIYNLRNTPSLKCKWVNSYLKKKIAEKSFKKSFHTQQDNQKGDKGGKIYFKYRIFFLRFSNLFVTIFH